MRAHRIAVFGSSGQIGSALMRRARSRTEVTGFTHAEVDITDAKAVRESLARTGATIAINAAAYTAVDRAESEPDRAYAINRDGAANLAEACRALDIALIHLSTDYVFDGTKAGSYIESDPIAPLGVYARSKAEGEAAVLRLSPKGFVLRTSWVYGLEGTNFVKTMLQLGTERDIARVVNDQRGSPTFADDLAHALLVLAGDMDSASSRIYHLAGQGIATWHELAREVFVETARRGLRTPRLEENTTLQYPTPARRPANSVLDSGLFKRDLGIELPPWRDGLKRMLAAHLETVR